jgi:hypothetical protein
LTEFILLKMLCNFQINMSNSYNLSNQKLLHEIKILEQNIYFLKCRTLTSPCISINGIDKLQICPLMKQTSAETSKDDIIQKLFKQLNIPNFWIHSIEIPQSNPKSYHLPSTVNIYLITDNIKMRVYNILIKYLKHTDQKSVSIKLHTI